MGFKRADSELSSFTFRSVVKWRLGNIATLLSETATLALDVNSTQHGVDRQRNVDDDHLPSSRSLRGPWYARAPAGTDALLEIVLVKVIDSCGLQPFDDRNWEDPPRPALADWLAQNVTCICPIPQGLPACPAVVTIPLIFLTS